MKDKLREEIAKTLFDWIDDDGWEWWEVDEAVKNHYRHKADSILSLIDAQRCVWTWENDINLYSTSCGDAWPLAKPFAFCPRCGKRIEVKNGQG